MRTDKEIVTRRLPFAKSWPAARRRVRGTPDGGVLGQVLMPEDVAGTVIEGMDAERFLILPHPRVGASFLRKATNYDAWLSRTRDRLRQMH